MQTLKTVKKGELEKEDEEPGVEDKESDKNNEISFQLSTIPSPKITETAESSQQSEHSNKTNNRNCNIM